MRRLLFSTSVLALLVGCSSQKSEVAKPIEQESKTMTTESNEAVGEAPVESVAKDNAESEGAVKTSNGPRKMTAGKASGGKVSTDEEHIEMPKHGSPDQDQIDAIKKEKQQDKK